MYEDAGRDQQLGGRGDGREVGMLNQEGRNAGSACGGKKDRFEGLICFFKCLRHQFYPQPFSIEKALHGQMWEKVKRKTYNSHITLLL